MIEVFCTQTQSQHHGNTSTKYTPPNTPLSYDETEVYRVYLLFLLKHTYIVGIYYEVVPTCTYNFGLKEENIFFLFIRKLSFSQPLKSHCTSWFAYVLERHNNTF